MPARLHSSVDVRCPDDDQQDEKDDDQGEAAAVVETSAHEITSLLSRIVCAGGRGLWAFAGNLFDAESFL